MMCKWGYDIMDIGLRFVAILIDVILLSIFYHKKNRIEYYPMLIMLLSGGVFLFKIVINNIFATSIQLLFVVILMYLWTRDRKTLFYFEIPMTITILFDILTFEIFVNNFMYGFILNALMKIFTISIAGEFVKLKIIGKLENFTIKSLVIIFIFINFLAGIYVITKGV